MALAKSFTELPENSAFSWLYLYQCLIETNNKNPEMHKIDPYILGVLIGLTLTNHPACFRCSSAPAHLIQMNGQPSAEPDDELIVWFRYVGVRKTSKTCRNWGPKEQDWRTLAYVIYCWQTETEATCPRWTVSIFSVGIWTRSCIVWNGWASQLVSLNSQNCVLLWRLYNS